MDIFWTIFAGSLTFVTGQIVLKMIIDPVNGLKKSISDTSNSLIMYANVYANLGYSAVLEDMRKEMSDEMRRLSSELQANMYMVPFYSTTSKMFGLPSKENITKAAGELIRLHNSTGKLFQDEGLLNTYAAQDVKDLLGIYIPTTDRFDPEYKPKPEVKLN